MKTISFYILPLILFIFLINCKTKNDQNISEQDIKVIKDEIERYEKIVRTGDFEKIKTIFTEDIIFIRPDSDNISGIESLYKIHYSNNSAIPEFWKEADGINGSGKIAFCFGKFGFTKGNLNGKYMEIREKQSDESWPISRLIWNLPSNE